MKIPSANIKPWTTGQGNRQGLFLTVSDVEFLYLVRQILHQHSPPTDKEPIFPALAREPRHPCSHILHPQWWGSRSQVCWGSFSSGCWGLCCAACHHHYWAAHTLFLAEFLASICVPLQMNCCLSELRLLSAMLYAIIHHQTKLQVWATKFLDIMFVALQRYFFLPCV